MQNSTIPSQNVATAISDKELYKKCQLYGGEARKWTKRFAYLLPEVERRQLYKKYGFYSIYDFSAKLAGMKHETVVDILRVTQKLEDKPLLRAQMETAGWGKLKVIATIATKENEKMLAEKVATMSKSTLETFVKEFRKQNDEDDQMDLQSISQHSDEKVQIRTGSAENEILQTAQGANFGSTTDAREQLQNRIFVRLLLTPKNELKLKELQRKFSREQKAPVDLNEVVEILLDAYERQLRAPVQKKQNVSYKVTNRAVSKTQKLPTRQRIKSTSTNVFANLRSAIRQKISSCIRIKPPSRHIPMKTKKLLHQKYAGRCAWPGCTKLPEFFHHTLRFSLNPSHNPDYLTPLCKNHERLAHHGLIENEGGSPENWCLRTEPDRNNLKYKIDKKVVSHYARSIMKSI